LNGGGALASPETTDSENVLEAPGAIEIAVACVGTPVVEDRVVVHTARGDDTSEIDLQAISMGDETVAVALVLARERSPTIKIRKESL
jgi:hypothetical protein